jgi:O-methyltransferase involved in polyketide biosynthesis
MTRSENGTWKLATSVGATASGQACPIMNDPYAEVLVRAVGVDFFTAWRADSSTWARSAAMSDPVG